jgi:hypothetical protein
MDAVILLSLAAIPFGVLISALRDRSLRRRSRFWLRFAGVVICIVIPWSVALVATVGEQGFVVLAWIGLLWGLLLVGLAPLLLFRGPGPDPGPSDDDGPGPEDDRQPPRRPIGGIPLPDAEPPTARVRGPHPPRPAPRRHRPARQRERPVRFARLIIAGTALSLVLVGALTDVSGAAARAHPRVAPASAVREAWGKLDLAFYFGPPAAICAQMTKADRRAFARAWPAPNCLAAARLQEQESRTCPSTGGFTPAQWRAGVRFNVAHLRVTILSATRARTVDPELTAETLVKAGGRWRFARGWPTLEC